MDKNISELENNNFFEKKTITELNDTYIEINNVYDSLGEITRQALADDAISLGLSCLNENIMSQPVAYNARMAINEAKLQIGDLMRVS